VPQPKSIGKVILSQTLPKMIAVAAFSAVVLLSGIYYLVANGIQHRHAERVKLVTETYQQALGNEASQLRALSQNSFVHEALNKPGTLSQYFLKTYLSSLNFGINKYAKISVYDSKGLLVATNKEDSTAHGAKIDNMPWYNQVVVNRKPYQSTKTSSITFVTPVIISNLVTGIVVSEFDRLEPFLLFNFEDSIVLIINREQRILYTSDGNEFSTFTIFDRGYLNDWRIAYESDVDDIKVIGLEKSKLFFREFYKFLSFALLSIAFIIINSFLSARTAGQLASETINRFIHSIKHVRKTQSIEGIDTNEFQVYEIDRLNNEFELLLQTLVESNLSKERVSSLMNSLNDLLVVFDLEGNLSISNSAFDIFALNTSLEMNKLLEGIFFLEDTSRLLNLEETLPDYEKHYLCNTGNNENQYYSVHWTRHALLNQDGELNGVIFVGLDTTKSHELEAEIHLKEAAIDGADSGIIILEIHPEDTQIIYANKGIEKLTGISSAQFLGDTRPLLDSPVTDKEVFKRIQNAARSNKPITEVIQLKKPDGSLYHLEIMLSPVSTIEKTTKCYYLGILKDVTEQHLTAQLLIEAKLRAEESAEMKSSFLASMSHEIRTPMNGVIGMLDILGESSLNEQQKNYVDIAQSSAESLLTIINDILDFSKVEAGKLIIDSISFNITDMLDGFVDSMAHQAHSKGLELILDTTGIDHRFVKGDPGRLRQIMTNLVGNAIKFTTRGEIVIKSELITNDDNRLMLNMSIKDTGVGIPREKQAHLFDPFTQVDGTHARKTQGTGLGLAIVKQLCEAMHGHVWLSSEGSRGSTFGFSVQLLPSEKTAPKFPKLNIKDKHILVIDENRSNRKVLSKQLEHWGLIVSSCTNGQEGIDLLKEKPNYFDAAIVDMNMPKINGSAFGKAVRSMGECKNIKLILMTSISQRGDAQFFADLGFNSYFPKPATSTDLIDALTILFENGDALMGASPLVTRHYVRSLRHDQTFSETYRVLLVEDNAVNQMISRKFIQSIGLNATIAQDGQVAIDTLNETNEPFDIILMDCQMPVLDGFEATRNIRKGEAGDRYLNIPIIAMTANAMKGDRELCLEAGMDDYVSKPLRKDVLLKTLKSWLDVKEKN